MHWGPFIFFTLLATAALTIFLAIGVACQLTHLYPPFILGTFFTKNREKASIYGLFCHFMLGLLFGFFYLWGFWVYGKTSILLGMMFGLVHGVFVLCVGLLVLPAIHPRMANYSRVVNEENGISSAQLLKSPGFLGLNYGSFTPFVFLIAHAIYGGVLALYVY